MNLWVGNSKSVTSLHKGWFTRRGWGKPSPLIPISGKPRADFDLRSVAVDRSISEYIHVVIRE